MNDVLDVLKGKKNDTVVDGKQELQIKNLNNQTKQELYGVNLEKHNKRVDKIHKQHVVNNNKKKEANCQKDEGTKAQSKNKIKKLTIAKEIKPQKISTDEENLRLREKKYRDIERYFDKIKNQNTALIENKMLVEKCLENNYVFDNFEDNDLDSSNNFEEEIIDETLEEINEEECSIDLDKLQLQTVSNYENLGNLQVYLKRISMLTKNFNSCEAGRYFLLKTAPLWDSLTQCIYRKSLVLKDMAKKSDKSMPEEYSKMYEEDSSNETVTKRHRDHHFVDPTFLETLIAGLDYELSDSDVYKAVLKAKSIVSKNATALDIMNLVKLILEYDIDLKDNVMYIVNGICRRTVFEYTKKRISYRILGYSKNTINRLQFLNKISLIPKHLLTLKNTETYVESIVLEFLTDDVKYSYLTTNENTILVDKMYPKERAERRMQEFFQTFTCGVDEAFDCNNAEHVDTKSKIYGMPRKNHLEKHADTQIDRLMIFIYKQLASSLSRKSYENVNNFEDVGELTRITFNIFARKITKMVFGMGGSYEERIYVLRVVMQKIAKEISIRSPKVLYKHKNKFNAVKKETPIDPKSLFSKQLQELRSPTKLIKRDNCY